MKNLIDQLTRTAHSASETASALYAKVTPIAVSTANSAVEGYAASKNYATGLIGTTKAIWHGLKMTYSTMVSIANLGKAALYDAPKMGANHFYYKDAAATQTAKAAGAASLSEAGAKLVEAYQAATAMLSEAYGATLNNIDGLVHTKNSVYYAGEATIQSAYLAAEGACLAYESTKTAYALLPSYNRVCETAQQSVDKMLSATTITSPVTIERALAALLPVV